jgi:hypothetical protein
LDDGGNDFADDRTDDLSHHEPDNIGSRDDHRGAEEREGEPGGVKKSDLHGTNLLSGIRAANRWVYEVGERVVP